MEKAIKQPGLVAAGPVDIALGPAIGEPQKLVCDVKGKYRTEHAYD